MLNYEKRKTEQEKRPCRHIFVSCFSSPVNPNRGTRVLICLVDPIIFTVRGTSSAVNEILVYSYCRPCSLIPKNDH